MKKGIQNMSSGGRLLSTLFSAVGLLPLRVLYGLSDTVAFLAGRIVGYRRKVIRKNLTLSFPDKDLKDLRKIERDFYRFLGDYFVETLKLGRMSEDNIKSRMRFENEEEVRHYLDAGRNVTLYLGHYCNWEWMSSIPLHFDKELHMGQIYHPLESKAADEAFLKIRGHCGATSIKMADTLPTLMKWRREGKPFMVGFIADQVPLFEGMHYFADFLHQETPTFTGPERLSRMFDSVVFYCDIRRDKRGYYTCRYVKMTDNPKSLPQFKLTQKYYDMLAESIDRQPALWLWSHNRWKRTKTDFVRLSLSGQTVQRMSVFLLETVC